MYYGLEKLPGKRQEPLLDTDKPLIALYIALGWLVATPIS
jgi:hypothetical protein